jgi:hypothetical protein
MSEHATLRETFTWGTFGKYFDKPLKQVLLKDIHDEHLDEVIKWIFDHRSVYSDETLNIMLNEKKYRSLNNIVIPEYDYYETTITFLRK